MPAVMPAVLIPLAHAGTATRRAARRTHRARGSATLVAAGRAAAGAQSRAARAAARGAAADAERAVGAAARAAPGRAAAGAERCAARSAAGGAAAGAQGRTRLGVG